MVDAIVHPLRSSKLKYVDAVDQALKCTLCNSPLLDPHSTDCSHLHTFCLECIREHLKERRSCPTCKEKVRSIEPGPRLVRKAVDRFEVLCPNHPRGCTFRCMRRKLLEHLEAECGFQGVICPLKCGRLVIKNDLDGHMRNCNGRPESDRENDRRKENEMHIKQMDSLNSKTGEMQTELQKMSLKVGELSAKLQASEERVAEQANEIQRLKEERDKWEKRSMEQTDEIACMQAVINASDFSSSPGPSSGLLPGTDGPMTAAPVSSAAPRAPGFGLHKGPAGGDGGIVWGSNKPEGFQDHSMSRHSGSRSSRGSSRRSNSSSKHRSSSSKRSSKKGKEKKEKKEKKGKK